MYCGYVVLRSLLKFDKIVLHMVLQLWKLSEICQLDMLQHNILSTQKAKAETKRETEKKRSAAFNVIQPWCVIDGK